jgi:hypothetical protein
MLIRNTHLPRSTEHPTPTEAEGYVMSSDDKRVKKGEVLLEYQEIEDRVKELQVEAKKMGDSIVLFGTMMQEAPASSIYLPNQAHHGITAHAVPQKIYQTMQDWERCFDVADKLRQAMHRLAQLKEQKERFGLR